MKHIYPFEEITEFENFQKIIQRFSKRLNTFQLFLEEEYALVDKPKGVVMTAVGYVLYAFSWSFLTITVGFLILGFFNVFMNAGVATFYQNNVPIASMGRVTSIFQLVQSVVKVLFILGIGILADMISLRITIVGLACIMLLAAFVFASFVLKPQKAKFYWEEEEEETEINQVMV